MTPTPEWYRSPAQILLDLGIVDPSDIDIEAIAEDCGATILYKPLTGCAARIMGYNDRAIITIDKDSPRPRQRFSAGHELGHWMKDRGQLAFQCSDTVFAREWSSENPETRANRFASDLLMPGKMFRQYARGKPITFESVQMLATTFCTSLTATVIRLIEYGDLPGMLICNSPEKREWFVASSDVKGKIWPEPRPGTGSIAHALLRREGRSFPPREVGSDEWLNHPNARNYWIHEDSRLLSNGLVLTLLWWKNEKQLIDIDNENEERASRRSDYRTEE
jgi:Zn-dependent peptidase ImmA (M78 family)